MKKMSIKDKFNQLSRCMKANVATAITLIILLIIAGISIVFTEFFLICLFAVLIWVIAYIVND